jgi:hypothetical protein
MRRVEVWRRRGVGHWGGVVVMEGAAWMLLEKMGCQWVGGV